MHTQYDNIEALKSSIKPSEFQNFQAFGLLVGGVFFIHGHFELSTKMWYSDNSRVGRRRQRSRFRTLENLTSLYKRYIYPSHSLWALGYDVVTSCTVCDQ